MQDSAAAEAAGEALQKGDETILLVDDEEAIINFGSEILKRYGYTVITASSGEEALAIYQKRIAEIDLVILDIGMPGMGGYKCLSKIIGINASAKVVVASGYSIESQVRETLDAGAARYIGKPYHMTDLLRKVRAVLDEN
jgi:DNA-binding response OmpR family regulator